MTFLFFQVPDGEQSTIVPLTYSAKWKAVGSSSISYVRAYAMGGTPAAVATAEGILYRQDIAIQQVAYNHFTVDVPYAKEKNVTGEWTWDFDTTGGSVHITNAKQEVDRFGAGAPDQKGAIGVDGDQVHGVEIVIPAMKINVTYKHPKGIITIPRAKYLSSITGMVNNSPFMTFAAGETLFLGARGSDGTESEASISYSFAMSLNASGLSIGDVAGVVKKGHDVAWVRYEDKDVGGKPTRVPRYVYVDRVYDTVDLASGLGFGG